MKKSAIISADGKYRYALGRYWDPKLPEACFIMLNPSTATDIDDDATIRKCIGFAERMSCGGLNVVNVYAYRSTDPRQLWKVGDPHGPENWSHIADAVDRSGPIVAAWGTHARKVDTDRILHKLKLIGRYAHALRLTKAGVPGHPLYIPYSAELVRI